MISCCSLCGKKGHNKNNKKYHSKKELEIHNNSILSKKLVNNIFKNVFKNIIFISCIMNLDTTESQEHGKTIENDIKKKSNM
jgi:hypothetical protein